MIDMKRIISLLVLFFCLFVMAVPASCAAKKPKKRKDFLPDLVVIADNVNLRAAPSTSSRVVTRMKRGTLLAYVMDSPEDWWGVETEDGYRGYVFAKYVDGASVLSDEHDEAF